jgi:hypothetical protein
MNPECQKLLRVYIGYDGVESVGWHAMAHSLLINSSLPLSIVPLNLSNLKAVYNRPRDPRQSNDFSFTRFLVPYLSDFSGTAVYFDCDMLMRVDIADLINESGIQNYSVCVVKHDYEPRNNTKYLNNMQYSYPRKNWSSVIVWNCNHKSNLILTPEFVNKSEASTLHRFAWLKDNEIGDLDIRWNWLVGEYSNPPKNVKNIHWTLGGPYFNEYKDVDFSDEWYAVYKKMNYCKQKKE